MKRLIRSTAWLGCLLALATSVIGALSPGLKVTFTGEPGNTDTTTRPNVALFVPADQPATPFLAPGRFSARWDGLVSLDLRSEYTFQALFRGDLKLELNGMAVLETNSLGMQFLRSKPIRLSKGTNSLHVSFRAFADGAAAVRLEWAAKSGLPLPIPNTALSHQTDEILSERSKVRHGRELIIEHRCVKCHTTANANGSWALDLDAPTFDGIGSRRNFRWLAAWIANPKSERLSARMPQILRGTTAVADAAAIASYLSSLKTDTGNAEPLPKHESGKELFEKLHCAACHHTPDSDAPDASRLSLIHVRKKFMPGALPGFLQAPETHYRSIGMPNFRLSSKEAASLAAYLDEYASPPDSADSPADPSDVARGKELVQTAGCLNCHSGTLQNRYATKPLVGLKSDEAAGCLSAEPIDGSKTPFFSFTGTERQAIAAFLRTDRTALTRMDLADFAERQIKHLRCGDCHGKFDGFPALHILGGKLKPEWSARFIAGEIAYKPRPWLEARMPGFKHRSGEFAQGMAMLHGYPPSTPAEPSLDHEAIQVGRQLVSADGGFSCVACHAVGDLAATQVFESAGVNLAYTAERLLKPYYHRWLMNPLAIEPTSKMPAYFDEAGRSPLTEFYDGDGFKQIDAIWEYIRLGPTMPAPGK